MNQPELGKRLSALRKARGLTQEELVERCNVSIRTIQRIETGDVMPRSYTIRSIVTALDYRFEEVFSDPLTDGEDESTHASALPPDTPKTSADVINYGAVKRKLIVSLIFGLLYFVLTFPEAVAEYVRFSDGEIIFGNRLYAALKVALVVSFAFFQRGFMLIGKLYDSYLLQIVALIHVVIVAALCAFDILSLHSPQDHGFIVATAAVLYGAVGLAYGISLIKLRTALGTAPLIAGALEIVSGCIFFTVALIPLADVISMFAELLQLIILFKVIDLVRSKALAEAT